LRPAAPKDIQAISVALQGRRRSSPVGRPGAAFLSTGIKTVRIARWLLDKVFDLIAWCVDRLYRSDGQCRKSF
jgi:hypothetical protein